MDAPKDTSTGRRIGPYTLISVLGESELGTTYRARDKAGNLVTVARLKPPADTDAIADADPAAGSDAIVVDADVRERFRTGVRALATTAASTSSVVGAEVADRRPWVATARGVRPGAEQLLIELGGTYRRRPVPVEPDPFPTFTPDRTAPPWESRPRLFWGVTAGVGALVLALCASGVTAAVVISQPAASPSGTPSVVPSSLGPTAAPSSTGAPTPSPSGAPSPTGSPVRPAPEPPTKGSWPASWAKFAAGEATYPMSLDGFGFSFRVPKTWGCLKVSEAGAGVTWRCIDEKYTGGGKGPGGDLTVRACPSGCGPAVQRQQRADIATYGQSWVEPEPNSTFAEGKNISTTAGSGRYALVLSRFWHSKSGGPLDRQVVVRLAAPSARAAQVQKVVNDIRTKTR